MCFTSSSKINHRADSLLDWREILVSVKKSCCSAGWCIYTWKDPWESTYLGLLFQRSLRPSPRRASDKLSTKKNDRTAEAAPSHLSRASPCSQISNSLLTWGAEATWKTGWNRCFPAHRADTGHRIRPTLQKWTCFASSVAAFPFRQGKNGFFFLWVPGCASKRHPENNWAVWACAWLCSLFPHPRQHGRTVPHIQRALSLSSIFHHQRGVPRASLMADELPGAAKALGRARISKRPVIRQGATWWA